MRLVALAVVSIGIAAGCAPTLPPAPSDPSEARLIGDDVPRFWASVDDGRASGDLAGALDRGYLGPGSPLLRSFLTRRIGSATQLADVVDRHAAYFDSIRGTTLSLASGAGWWGEVQAAYAEMERIEPRAVFPPVAILVGRMNSGGTTSSEGISIGVELFSAGPGAVLDGLTDEQRALLGPPDRMAALVVHEHAHVLQETVGGLRSGDDRSLLERALVEGVADFVAESLLGVRPTSDTTIAYGEANEAAVWADFSAVMDGRDITGWLYGPGTAGRPRDLGYFVGHRIAARYAASRGDPDAAIRELLGATDARAILAESGYDGTGP